VGAVWRSSRDIHQSGLAMTTVNTFSLVGLDGDKLQYTIDTDVHGADQTVKMDGASLDVKDITGTGGGNGSFSLTSLEATAVLSAEFRSQMSAPGETAPTPMKMVTQTKLAPQGQPMPGGSAAPPAEGSGAAGSGSAGSGSAGSAAGSATGSATGSGSATPYGAQSAPYLRHVPPETSSHVWCIPSAGEYMHARAGAHAAPHCWHAPSTICEHCLYVLSALSNMQRSAGAHGAPK
jgi:hypothetical protein